MNPHLFASRHDRPKGAGKIKLRPRIATISALLFAVAVLLALSASSALAAAPSLFTQVPEDGKSGTGAGQMAVPRGIVAEQQLPGHVYVDDNANFRIDEFTPWGEFVKAWGWGVRDGNPALETCTVQTTCRKGIQGFGTGQFEFSEGLAVDGEGNVYVMEDLGHRVQKFDPDGGPGGEAEFLLAFGWKVDKTRVETAGSTEAEQNLCTFASGDECQVGASGSGPGQFGADEYRGRLAADPTTNAVFVGEKERIEVFERSGAFKEEIAMPAGKKVEKIATDAVGGLYVFFAGVHEIHELEPHGPTATFLSPTFKLESPEDELRSLALDGSGHLYVAVKDLEFGPGVEPARVLEYDSSGKCLLCGGEGEGGKSGFDRSTSQLEGVAASSACGSDDVYDTRAKPSGEESFFRAFGQTPDPVLCEPPKRPPSVDDQFAFAVETGEATVKGKVNPHFWSGSLGATTYRVQYATLACFEAGGWGAGCVQKTPAVVLPGGAVNEDVTVSVELEGLVPGTSYRYRFAAEGAGEAGEVLGVGGTPGTPGRDAGFATFRMAGLERCSGNEAFRSGSSARLPDCRAYELVSPIDKEGGDIVVGGEFDTSLPAVLSESASSGDRLAYGSARSFGGAVSGPYTTQYVAARHAGAGWVTHPISPPRGKNIFGAAAVNLDTEFRFFSGDLCSAWLESYAALPPAESSVPAGVADLFRRSDEECGGPVYQALNTVAPPVAPGEQFHIELQGLSEDESMAVFQANDKLAEGGTSGPISSQYVGPKQLYGVQGGEERFLCILPGGPPWTESCTTGGGGKPNVGRSREGNVTGAFSGDGTKLYWTTAAGEPGHIYLRENPFGAFGAGGEECAEVEPCTVAVSEVAEEAAGTSTSQFWAAAKDGSTAIFTTGGRLFEYRASDQSTHLIAGEVLGIAGQSEDLSRIYLVSEEALTAPGEENEHGDHAQAGKANLYLHEAGGFRFIGALAPADVLETVAPASAHLSPVALSPLRHTARVSADGGAVAFMSVAPLTGYDSTDAATGQADAEVFLYEAAANEGKGELVCASCDPSGARPQGTLAVEGSSSIRAAAKISVPQNMFYPGRELSDDGKRLFFESYDSLSPRDTNGQKDVYQWEAPEEGRCTISSATYSPQDQGCVDLISSGQSLRESSFLDASPSGKDVFFLTLSSLLPQDPGLVDVYDAREGGGLPAPPSRAAGCEGEACQAPAVALSDLTPGSLTFSGAGNLLSQSVVTVKAQVKVLTLAQRLAKALEACQEKPKSKRAGCRARARKQYRPVKARKAHNNRRAGR